MAIKVIDFTGNEKREDCIVKKLSRNFYNNGKSFMVAMVFGSDVKVVFQERNEDTIDQIKGKGVEEIDQLLAGSRKTFDYSKGTYEKVFIRNLFKEQFLKIWIENVGVFILFFKEKDNETLELALVPQEKFDEKAFFDWTERYRKMIAESEEKARAIKIQEEKDRAEAARKEMASKVCVPTKIFTIGEDVAISAAPEVVSADGIVTHVTISPRSKKDVSGKPDDRSGETYRPFASLSPKARTDRELEKDFEAGFEKLEPAESASA